MFKDIRVLAVILGLSLLWGCYDSPEFDESPEISYENISFVDSEEGADSLILSFNFTDGNGDIGLAEGEVFYPFHSTNFVIDSRSEFVYDNNLDVTWVRRGTSSFIEFGQDSLVGPFYLMAIWESLGFEQPRQYDGLVVGVFSEDDFVMPPLRCDTYTFVQDTTNAALQSDTLLISPNDFKDNIVLDFFRKRGGVYENITNRFTNSPCAEVFRARIPIFDEDNFGRPIVGTINYPLISRGFKTNFINDSIMIEMYIYDRALNQSNVLRTPDFTLPALLGEN